MKTSLFLPPALEGRGQNSALQPTIVDPPLEELLEILSQGAKKSLVRKLAFSQIYISHSHKSTVPSVPLRKTLTIKSIFEFKVQT